MSEVIDCGICLGIPDMCNCWEGEDEEMVRRGLAWCDETETWINKPPPNNSALAKVLADALREQER